MTRYLNALCKKGMQCTLWLEKYAEPVLLLSVRLQMASLFYRSGQTKLDNLLAGNWQATVDLFADVHPVPGLPAELAAPLSLASEVGFAGLLAFGLAGRLAALGLLGVTGIIYLTHQANLESLGEFTEAPLWRSMPAGLNM